MQKKKIRLVVSDFDGTLLDDKANVTEIAKANIEKLRNAGGAFAISTGRMPNGIVPHALELGLKGAVSCFQGAVIIDLETKKVLFEGRIPNKSAVAACKKLEALNLHIHAYDLWDFYCNKDDDALKEYETMMRSKAKLVLDKPLSQFLEETGIDIFKLVAMVPVEDNEYIRQTLENEPIDGCVVTRSGAHLVEINNANYSKGTAVEFLSRYYGVSIEETLCVGDQLNDISMIEKAGLGVAVKNADERLKQAADYVCEYTNNEGAVGRLIEKFCFDMENV